MNQFQTFLLGATCTALLILVTGAASAPSPVVIESAPYEMHNLAEEGRVLIFNKLSGEISYENIDGEISDVSYTHTIKNYVKPGNYQTVPFQLEQR